MSEKLEIYVFPSSTTFPSPVLLEAVNGELENHEEVPDFVSSAQDVPNLEGSKLYKTSAVVNSVEEVNNIALHIQTQYPDAHVEYFETYDEWANGQNTPFEPYFGTSQTLNDFSKQSLSVE